MNAASSILTEVLGDTIDNRTLGFFLTRVGSYHGTNALMQTFGIPESVILDSLTRWKSKGYISQRGEMYTLNTDNKVVIELLPFCDRAGDILAFGRIMTSGSEIDPEES